MSERLRETAPALVSAGGEAANEAGRAALKGLAPAEAPKPATKTRA